DGIETIVGRDALLQIQKTRKPLASRLAELGNGHEVVGPADDRADGDCDDVDQGIDGWPSSGIGESSEVVLNLGGLLGHDVDSWACATSTLLPLLGKQRKSQSPSHSRLPKFAQSPWAPTRHCCPKPNARKCPRCCRAAIAGSRRRPT